MQVVFGDGLFGGAGFGAFNLFALPLVVVAAGAIRGSRSGRPAWKAQIDTWFLGVDRLAAAEQRVSDLSIQRQDILDAVASERRRIERNLHDGVQQQLVAIGLDLGMAANHVDTDPEAAKELIVSAAPEGPGLDRRAASTRPWAAPAILEDRGIDAALSAIVGGAPIPISVHVDPDLDLSTDVAETVYFIANEAIANVLKHAGAGSRRCTSPRVAANVRVTVHDDGAGGADPAGGTGILGIRARVRAVDGTLLDHVTRRRADDARRRIPRRHGEADHG